jgi:uncharacterized protein (TIGR03435 family)
MMQNLLAERFRLSLHHISKEFQAYELVVGKNGPKFKESVSGQAPSAAVQSDPLAMDKQGFPQLPPGSPGMTVRSGSITVPARLTARQQPISALAEMLRPYAGHPVLDRTGLTGKYDFHLEFDWRLATEPSTDSAPSIFLALEQQLGLKLESKRLPFDVLVIDHAEKIPTEN